MTFNFYVKAKTLQIQGKENANQLRVELVNLASSKKPKWQRRTRYEEQNEQDGVEASRSSDEEGDEENNTLTYQPSILSTSIVLRQKDLTLLT